MATSDRSDPDRGIYSISVAAELAGLHPQTLRLYEQKGLLEPARTQGGTRRYSDRDIARLRRITELVQAGVNLTGIKHVLDRETRLRSSATSSPAGQNEGRNNPRQGTD